MYALEHNACSDTVKRVDLDSESMLEVDVVVMKLR